MLFLYNWTYVHHLCAFCDNAKAFGWTSQEAKLHMVSDFFSDHEVVILSTISFILYFIVYYHFA